MRLSRGSRNGRRCDDKHLLTGEEFKLARKTPHRRAASIVAALITIIATSVFLIPVRPGRAQGPANPQASPTATPSDNAPATPVIPAAQIVWRVESLSLALQDISNRLSSGRDISELTTSLESRDAGIESKSGSTLATLGGTPTLTELEEEAEPWRDLLQSNLVLHAELTKRSTAINNDIAALEREQQQWQSALDQSQDPNALEAVYDRIRDALIQIDNLLARAHEDQRRLVSVQLRLQAEDTLANDLLQRLNREKQQFQRRLLQRDSLPIWRVEARRDSGEFVDSTMRGQAPAYWDTARRSIRAQAGRLTIIVIVFLLNVALTALLRRKWAGHTEGNQTRIQLDEVLQHPIAVSLLAALILISALDFNVPLAFLSLMGLVMAIPVLRLLPGMIDPHWRPLLYLVTITFMQTVIRHSLVPPSPIVRELDALFNLGVIIAFCVITLRQEFREVVHREFWSRCTIRAARVAIVLFTGALVANVIGYLRLSQIVNRATIYSSFLGIIAFISVHLVMVIFSALLKTDRARALATVRMQKKVVLQWTQRVLAVFSGLSWLASASDLFMIREPVEEALEAVLTFPIELGTLHFTLGNILTVVLVLFVGLGFSSAVRFVLREEVLARVHLSRGVPELITTLLYYGLVIIVVVMAFGAAGVEFSRLTLITGALGVGIGFGLQNIVNNFVSGLILQFERPIHVGDILEVGGLSGEVTRIGVRSSTIQTGQGAEVIVPNGDLVSGRVINWTLSSERRRIDIPVTVAYGTEPKRVVTLLIRVALENRAVMRSPAPVVLFEGFNEQGLTFDLRFWAPDRTAYPQLKSEVALAVIEALTAEGIETPSTQRDLYLKVIEEAVKSQFSGAVAIGEHVRSTAKSEPTTQKAVEK